MLDKIKYIIIFFVCYSYIQAETLGSLNEIKVVMPKLQPVYHDVHYELDKHALLKQEDKWSNHNTGCYVYILDGNNTSYQLYELKNKLIFVRNNSLEWSINLLDIKDKRKNMKNHHPQEYKGKKRRCGTPRMMKIAFNESLALSNRFPTQYNLKTYNICRKIKLEHEYNAKYGYVSFEKEQCIGVSNSDTRVSYVYGFLLLPGNEPFTDKVINKILDKYEKAFECAEDKLQHKDTRNDSSQIMLEKAVGKEKLQCLDKYLVWDENVSK